MALGFGEKKASLVDNSNDRTDMETAKNPSFGGNGYYDGFSPAAAEEGGRKAAPRKMSRIDQPRTKSITGSIAGRGITEDDASDPSVSVAKQMELESGNEIQYRTCSWQKVRFVPIVFIFLTFMTIDIDRCLCERDAHLPISTQFLSLSHVHGQCNATTEFNSNHGFRLRLCCSQNTSVWPLCPSRTPTQFSALCLVSS